MHIFISLKGKSITGSDIISLSPPPQVWRQTAASENMT